MTMTATITVGTADLRSALNAVAPHADPDPKFSPLHRIRLAQDPVNVTVSATNRYTAGLAIVSVEEASHDDGVMIDLSVADVKEILMVFKQPKGDDGENPDATIRLHATEEHTTITDVSGLFPGKALTLPRYPVEDNFPDMGKVIGQYLQRHKAMADQVVTSGRLLKLFSAAATAYGHPLVVESSGEKTALLIACGESFLGLLMPQNPADDQKAELALWRQAWLQRLAHLLPAEVGA